MAVAISKNLKQDLWDNFITTQEAGAGFAIYLYKETVNNIIGPGGANLTSLDEVTQAHLVTWGTVVGGVGADEVIFDHGTKYADIILESYSVSSTAYGLRNSLAVTVTTEAGSVSPATVINSYAVVYGNLDVTNAACEVLILGDFASQISIGTGDASTDYTIPAQSITVVAD